MPDIRLVMGDQLSHALSALDDIDRNSEIVLMVEISDEITHVKHHKQKVVLVLSAMRHFAEALRASGIMVDYVSLNDEGNTGSFDGEIRRAIERHDPERIIMTEPSEWRVVQIMKRIHKSTSVDVEIRPDTRFLCSHDMFEEWAKGRTNLLMEHFYREMRKRTGWLMDGDEPAGGKWNYDSSNRKPLPSEVSLPNRMRFAPDQITRDVINLVEHQFGDHFGSLDSFGWPVTRKDALKALDHFVTDCLPQFGDYQDAMSESGDFLFHSLLSPSINIGLLEPEEVCQAAVDAHGAGKAPLEATEGFVRQILGWREYIRGIYWLKMPEYETSNYLSASRDLPWLYWSGETDMNCMRHTIDTTRKHAYAHHIQRLMITGNFALLAGIEPKQVEEWYLIVYADAFDWVELPNTHGMALYADGGLLSTKPYAASGSYINKMSDYCKACAFDVKKKLGPKACPFNYLYWYFLIANEEKLGSNHRLRMPYATLRKMGADRREQIVENAERFLDSLG